MEYWTMLLQLVLIGAAISFGIQLIYKFLTTKKARESREELNKLRNQLKTIKDPAELQKLQAKMLELNSHMMKGMIIPMIASMLIYTLLYPVIGNYFSGFVVYQWESPNLPIIGTDIGWLLGIALTQMIFTPIFKKLLKVQ